MKKMSSVLLYGIHAVLAALKNPHRTTEKLWLKEKNVTLFATHLKKIAYEIVDDKKLDTLLPKGAIHQGVVLRTSALDDLSLEEVAEQAADKCCLIFLDQVTDPQNLGAILRSCAAFAVDALVVPEAHSPQFEGTIAKVASGALEQVPVIRVTNLSRALETVQAQGFWCYGFAEEATEVLGKTKITGKVALIFGAEGEGLRRLTKEICDVLVKLPTSSHFTTLNVAQTVSIAAFEVQKSKLL